jgi:hypothetical protein
MSKEISSAYLHIGNSGVTFSVIDEGFGPCILIKSSTFGNNVIEQRVQVTTNELKVLAKLFDYASNKEGYSEPYCHAARVVPSMTCDAKDDGLMGADPCSSENKCCLDEEKTLKYKRKNRNPYGWKSDGFKNPEKYSGDDNGL